MHWYQLKHPASLDSPALIVYPDRVKKNIDSLLSMIDLPSRLRPHIKTNKSREAVQLMMNAGVTKFKCATIAEAEMLGDCGAPDVVLAYQPQGPKLKRFVQLVEKFHATQFATLVDNTAASMDIGEAFNDIDKTIQVYLDLNVGMNRTGIRPGPDAVKLYADCTNIDGLKVVGLHAYDGHIRNPDLDQRKIDCDEAFAKVEAMRDAIISLDMAAPIIIAGGSPSFPIHAKRDEVECSPGTFIFWDKGYSDLCPDQPFEHAALVMTRVISLPDNSKLCLDLGHKSIAAENELAKRVHFLNAPQLKAISQSEEHLVVEAGEDHPFKVGDVLYGLPFHICPTVALYERAYCVEHGELSGEWKIVARDRKLTI